MATIQNLINIKIYEENRVVAIITIFGRLQDIHPDIFSANFCAIPPQKIWVIKWIFTISEITYMKALQINNKFTFSLYFCRVYWYLEVCSLWLRKTV